MESKLMPLIERIFPELPNDAKLELERNGDKETLTIGYSSFDPDMGKTRVFMKVYVDEETTEHLEILAQRILRQIHQSKQKEEQTYVRPM